MGQNTLAVTDSNFAETVLQSEVPVLVDFWAPWCGPCMALGPTIDALADEYQGKIKITKMNVDENTNVPAEYGVRSIPYLVVFKNGQVTESLVGAVPKAKLKTLLDKSLA